MPTKLAKGRCVKKLRLAQKKPTIDQPNKTDLIQMMHPKIDEEFGNLTLLRGFRRVKSFEVFQKTGSQFRK